MRESSTYQLIADEGSAKTRREDILELGIQRFGEPAPAIRSALSRLEDISQLGLMMKRLLTVSSWAELMKPQHTRKRKA